MKELNPTLKKLVQQLNDGAFHSGTSLGEALGISRNAVWKQLTQLAQQGIGIESIKNRGHRLVNPLILLDKHKITDQLSKPITSMIETFDIFASLSSTNDYIKSLPRPNLDHLRICVAEHQSNGKGRHGRTWFSPFGTNIYLSCGWHVACDLSELGGLGLVVMIAVADAITKITGTEGFKIKWPNDLLFNDNKVCGCLVEIQAESYYDAWVTMGIGIDVNMKHNGFPIDTPWASLFDITQKYFDRNVLIAGVLNHLSEYLKLFKEKGFSAFLDKWQNYDYLLSKTIEIACADKKWTGKMLGVDKTGQLILQDVNDTISLHSSGDTTHVIK